MVPKEYHYMHAKQLTSVAIIDCESLFVCLIKNQIMHADDALRISLQACSTICACVYAYGCMRVPAVWIK